MLKMLIAFDGSDHARRAVEAVARVGKDSPGLSVVLLNVQDPPLHHGDFPPLDFESIDSKLRERQLQLLEGALAWARQCGLEQVTTLAAMGATAVEIVRVAAECAADQIVIGTHGRSALGSLFLGSVAQRVVHLARTPVLMVK